MANLDHHVAAVLDHTHPDSDLDEDALIASLEDDDNAMDHLRERRLQQLHEEVARQKLMQQSEHGTYQEIKDEKALMDITTSTKLCVVHFSKADFGRCGIMDKHLETLATRHFDTRFLKIDVTNAPFLVAKLKVQVLPCVLAFIDGVNKDRILGFEGLGRGDNFQTQHLEARLLASGVLVRQKVAGGEAGMQKHGVNGGRTRKKDDEDDEDDWD